MTAGDAIHCHPRAFAQMRAQLGCLETVEGLRDAVLAIAVHHTPTLDPADVASRLEGVAGSIRQRLSPRPTTRAVVAHAHQHLFEELGYRGDLEDYYDPANSDLASVLERRRGLPIMLALVYKLVLEALGVRVRGVNAPGHFLARIEGDGDFRPMLVDPFLGGRVLSLDEALERVASHRIGESRTVLRWLPMASHRDWVLRILRNLMGSHHERGRDVDRRAMEELFQLVSSA